MFNRIRFSVWSCKVDTRIVLEVSWNAVAWHLAARARLRGRHELGVRRHVALVQEPAALLVLAAAQSELQHQPNTLIRTQCPN